MIVDLFGLKVHKSPGWSLECTYFRETVQDDCYNGAADVIQKFLHHTVIEIWETVLLAMWRVDKM
jgi:hypothetical protein